MKVLIEGKEIEIVKSSKVKKAKSAEIICSVDGELIEFKNEAALKAFMWKERPEKVTRYDLIGTVSVPFDLVTLKGN